MMDSGSSFSLVTKDLASFAGTLDPIREISPKLVTANGDYLPIQGNGKLKVAIGSLEVNHDFLIAPALILALRGTKCEIGKDEVEYLGHVFSKSGMAPNPSRVSAIEEWPRPQSSKDVRQFLGLANYYRRFVRNFRILLVH